MTNVEKHKLRIDFYSHYEGDLNKNLNIQEWFFDDHSMTLKKELLSDKSYKDFSKNEREFLDTIYLTNLDKFKVFLNEYHKYDASNEQWEILIGPWLRIYVYALYDRWRTLENLSSKIDPLIFVKPYQLSELVPNNFDHFHKLFYEDQWNCQVYAILGNIMGYEVKKHISEKSLKPLKQEKDKPITFNVSKKIASFCFRSIFYIFYFIRILRDQKISAFYELQSYREFSTLLFLNGNGFPLMLKKNILKNINPIKRHVRLREYISLCKGNKENIKFSEVVYPLSLMAIPKTYLEDFKEISLSKELKFIQKNLTNVFSSTSQWNDDTFKKWLFEKKIQNSDFKIIIWQHGGTYGTTKYLTHQEYIETKIYDYFLSWGWEEGLKVLPFKMPKSVNFPKSNKKNHSNKILIILTRVKNYSKGDPWDSIEWNRNYVQGLTYLCQNLSNCVDLTFRLHPAQASTGIDLKSILQKLGDKISFDHNTDVRSSISQSKLTIITQNSTALLQALKSNYPTICFWDTSIMEFRPTAEENFNKLRSASIFHDDACSVTNFILENNHRIIEWWNSELVQEARKEFCEAYASSDKLKSTESMKLIK